MLRILQRPSMDLPPEDVVPTIVFLCSAMNTAVTGEIIRASGAIT